MTITLRKTPTAPATPAAHTPAPWAFIGNTLVHDTGRRQHLGTFSEANGVGTPAAGNRRLIEAAPAMLESLRELAFMVESVAHLQGREELLAYTDKARAIIATIEGKSE